MAAFYLDNDVAVQLGGLLRIAGHSVTLTKERHESRSPDEQQLLTALELNASLVTHNYRDYVLLHRAWELWRRRWGIVERHPPILVLPQGPEPKLLQYLVTLLQQGPPAYSAFYRYRPARAVWERQI